LTSEVSDLSLSTQNANWTSEFDAVQKAEEWFQNLINYLAA